jgi:hypothetical protein
LAQGIGPLRFNAESQRVVNNDVRGAVSSYIPSTPISTDSQSLFSSLDKISVDLERLSRPRVVAAAAPTTSQARLSAAAPVFVPNRGAPRDGVVRPGQVPSSLDQFLLDTAILRINAVGGGSNSAARRALVFTPNGQESGPVTRNK